MDQRTGAKRERDRVEIIQSQNDEAPGKRSRNTNENYPTIQLAGPLRYQDQQVCLINKTKKLDPLSSTLTLVVLIFLNFVFEYLSSKVNYNFISWFERD